MNYYKAIYRRKTLDVQADTALAAQTKAAGLFKARKRYEVTVVLVQNAAGPVVHAPQDICS